MNPREIGHLTDDPLFALQLRVARRADELRQNPPGGPAPNLDCWLLAESEILAGFDPEGHDAIESLPPSAPTRAAVETSAPASIS